MKTKDEVFQQYEETLVKISQEFSRAKKEARATLQGQLKAIRVSLHEELKAVRAIQQKTKGGKQDAR